MFPVLVTCLRSSYTESHTRSGNPQPRSKFHFLVEQEHVYVSTMNDGSETSFRVGSNLLPEQVFIIEFPYLLIPEVSEIKIHAMLTQMEIPPDSIERIKRQITHYAFQAASFCRERIDVCEAFDILIGLSVPLAQYYRGVDDHIEWFESMDIGGEEGSMRLVPASRSSIQALEIKKFDDIEEGSSSSSSSTETCMICMDEYVRGVDVARLPCSHLFHGECIVKWLERKNSCPLCRSLLPSEA
ncbi:E3 ubiquitin-protein ligase RNF165-like [Macadamia integrifolia]|uniref:E3 ubiquitin-protein ligase RNF165-like n=1 Tax=Macadamia integrifolia TaxID=60698 RepID=UPI001C4E6723|nr:E3 ubiquitin-protein ligase RNF165-like [Macadamia integrifolia]